MSSELSPEEFERAARVSVLGPAWPYIAEALKELEELALVRACQAIGAGTLTGEVASATLHSVKSYRDLARRIKGKIGEAVEFRGL